MNVYGLNIIDKVAVLDNAYKAHQLYNSPFSDGHLFGIPYSFFLRNSLHPCNVSNSDYRSMAYLHPFMYLNSHLTDRRKFCTGVDVEVVEESEC